jgi:hypothetical protein
MSENHKRKSPPPPTCKELSLSFRAECMGDVVDVFTGIFADQAVMKAICGYSAKLDAMGVNVVLEFRAHDTNNTQETVAAIKTALTLMAELDGDVHVINETLNFTDEYDSERTYTGEQRPNLMERIADKLAIV